MSAHTQASSPSLHRTIGASISVPPFDIISQKDKDEKKKIRPEATRLQRKGEEWVMVPQL